MWVRKLALATIIILAIGFQFSLDKVQAAENYGTWSSGSTNNSEPVAVGPAYDNQLAPFNDDQLSETTSFLCVSPSGAVINQEQQEYLASIFLTATEVYEGEYQPNGSDPGNKKSKNGPPKNGGYPKGTSGMQNFLRNEINLLQNGDWAPYDQRKIIRSPDSPNNPENIYTLPTAGWSGEIAKNAQKVPAEAGSFIAQFINPNVENPLYLAVNLPEACSLGAETPSEPDFADFFTNPGKFQTDSFLYTPTSIATSALEFLQPYAFRWTFWTPHSERGDLLWNTPQVCAPTVNLGATSPIRANCSTSAPLGFSGLSSNRDTESVWYLQVANFLQWFISGTFVLIIFGAAIIYMFKGNRTTQVKLADLFPRMALALGLTAMSGIIIGTIITFSNTLVELVFNFSDTESIGAVNNFLLQSGNIIGGDSVLQDTGQMIVSIITSFFFLVFVGSSIVRQLLLVMLIILAPVACFALLSVRWQRIFQVYVRALTTVIFVPVILAFILKVGLSLNPLVTDPIGSYGSLQGVLGLGMMLITLWLMYKALRISFEWIRGGGAAVSEHLGWDDDNRLVQLLRSNNSKDDSSGDRPGLVPANTVPAQAQTRALVNPDNAVSTKQLPAGSTGPSASPGAVISRATENAKAADSGNKRISTIAAQNYQRGLRNAVGAATAQKGALLTEEEKEKIKRAYARKNGGKLAKRDGSFYLQPVEEETVHSRG